MSDDAQETARHDRSSPMGRRRFLGAVGGVAGLAAMSQLPAGRADAGPQAGYPFTLGVGSGDPTSSGVVLWTRLVPEPYRPDGGMPARDVVVEWQLARDPRFRRIVRRGTSRALVRLAHSVHVELDDLPADREFYYRFRYRGAISAVGRTRTAPHHFARTTDLAFGFMSCQDWQSGYYPTLRRMGEEDLDVVFHLGDYVYEGGIPADGGYRKTPVPEVLRPAPRGLDRWRMQYALYRSDPDLQFAHTRFPWVVTWDDHEVQNDYANTQSQYEGDITALRAAAYQAWYEHQAVRRPARPDRDGPRIYRRIRWGDLAQFDVVDGRQYRSVPPCGWGEANACAAAYDPEITMLGRPQERWLYEGLQRSQARWDILASNVMMARLDHDGDAGSRLWHDAWDGYPAARNRITRAWERADTRNPVVITGDWHSTFVNDIRADFDKEGSPVVATEFVGTSLTTNGDQILYGPYYGPMIKYNPHIQFFDGDRRGYVSCRLNRRELKVDLQMVPTVSRRDVDTYTHASFVVEDRRPGAQRVA